jgi:hypothetical protein
VFVGGIESRNTDGAEAVDAASPDNNMMNAPWDDTQLLGAK